MTCLKFDRGIICITPKFKVGDPCPDGYMAREEWWKVQYKAGLRQTMCSKCKRYFFPFEKHNPKKCKGMN